MAPRIVYGTGHARTNPLKIQGLGDGHRQSFVWCRTRRGGRDALRGPSVWPERESEVV
jgi:hypothetical protein